MPEVEQGDRQMRRLRRGRVRVAILTGQLGKGGAEKGLYNLLAHADRSRFHFTVICLNPGGWWAKPIRDTGTEVVEVPENMSGTVRRCKFIVRLLRNAQPDILHSWNFYPTAYCAVCGRVARIPVLIGSLRNEPEIILRKFGFKAKLIFRSVHGFVINSQYARTLLQRINIKTAPLLVVYNAVEVPEITDHAHAAAVLVESWEIPRGPSLIGTVGRLIPEKNHTMFLRVLKKALESGNNVHGIIIGDGPLRKALQGEADRMRLRNNLTFTGARDNVQELLPGLSVFCLTSISEGLSNAVMEAMAAGVPVVATDVGGIRELIDDGVSGFIVPSEDTEAMVEKVMRLLDSAELRRKVGMAGREKMMREFTVERMTDRLQNVYIEVLRKKGYEL